MSKIEIQTKMFTVLCCIDMTNTHAVSCEKCCLHTANSATCAVNASLQRTKNKTHSFVVNKIQQNTAIDMSI